MKNYGRNSRKEPTMDYAKRLLAWFDTNKRDMPWRKTRDPYAIWVSEIMLQQTQVDTVIPYYERFMNRFPTVHSLAEAALEEVYIYWQGLGYYRRAENLHKGAKMVDEIYQGVFPEDIDLVRKIPGIGPYTLGAVLSIAFHKPVPAVDGNVMRILARQFLINEDIAVSKNKKIFENKVMELMPDDPNRFNQALMELGALVCTPKNPNCGSCPVQELCQAYNRQVISEYPFKGGKTKVLPIKYYVLMVQKGDSYWIEKRPQGGLLANLWGFPLIEEKKFEEIEDKLFEIKRFDSVTHVFTHRRWEMQPVLVAYHESEGIVQLISQQQEGAFMTLKEMKKVPIGTAFKKVLKELGKG